MHQPKKACLTKKGVVVLVLCKYLSIPMSVSVLSSLELGKMMTIFSRLLKLGIIGIVILREY